MTEYVSNAIPNRDIGMICNDTKWWPRQIRENCIFSSSIERHHVLDVMGIFVENAKKVHNDDKQDTLVLFGNEWSDGFEPSLSIKGNRGSCWIKSITISPPPDRIHCMTHTYPIAIGTDGVSHEEVEQLFAEELISLSSGKDNKSYHGGLRKNVKVYFELLASLQDQLERRSVNYIMLGNSQYTASWRVALDIAAVSSAIPACDECFKKLIFGQVTSTICEKCVNWDLHVRTGLLDFSPPVNYPRNQVPPSGKLLPITMTYETMKAAVAIAHEGMVSDNWTKLNVEAYMRVNGLNSDAI